MCGENNKHGVKNKLPLWNSLYNYQDLDNKAMMMLNKKTKNQLILKQLAETIKLIQSEHCVFSSSSKFPHMEF